MTPLREHPVLLPGRNLGDLLHEGFVRSCPVRGVSQKKIPPVLAVTWDLRVWATDALAEWIMGIQQRPF
ncbi:MAG: hypothetical protein ABIG67_08945 [Pseudomonadota bacterium]